MFLCCNKYNPEYGSTTMHCYSDLTFVLSWVVAGRWICWLRLCFDVDFVVLLSLVWL